ncbi:uncharacterized protein LOC112128566 [Pongo abelii]|uniref:uncharacterized protein LOC112128566 n=1 Tax=Pongo abelii TaxID=9601 RepID=UPI000CEFCC60|nr:uncharacterized protein LOC112128566 [Pongo abelii]XP_054302172.1 uncharacterized protein LOC129011366 [Pongo pygmaeus]
MGSVVRQIRRIRDPGDALGPGGLVGGLRVRPLAELQATGSPEPTPGVREAGTRVSSGGLHRANPLPSQHRLSNPRAYRPVNVSESPPRLGHRGVPRIRSSRRMPKLHSCMFESVNCKAQIQL